MSPAYRFPTRFSLSIRYPNAAIIPAPTTAIKITSVVLSLATDAAVLSAFLTFPTAAPRTGIPGSSNLCGGASVSSSMESGTGVDVGSGVFVGTGVGVGIPVAVGVEDGV